MVSNAWSVFRPFLPRFLHLRIPVIASCTSYAQEIRFQKLHTNISSSRHQNLSYHEENFISVLLPSHHRAATLIMAPLSAGQIRDCVVAERVSASISVTGILIMITAFYTFSRLHTLSNQLLIYASFANLGANAAALIGGSGLSRVSSPLCQAQAFLLEW